MPSFLREDQGGDTNTQPRSLVTRAWGPGWRPSLEWQLLAGADEGHLPRLPAARWVCRERGWPYESRG